MSGEKILDGAVYYRDIVDLKPPLIYYHYAAAIALFGDSAISIRIVDLLLQLATCYMIALLVRRVTGDTLWSTLSAMMYAVMYTSLSPNSTAIPESYLGLLGVPMLLLLDVPRFRRGILVGVLGGVLFLLKFPLAAMLGAAALLVLLSRDVPLPVRWRMIGGMALGFVVTAALLPLYLLLSGTTDDFLLVGQFMRGYAGVGRGSAPQIVRDLIESTAEYFGVYFSLSLWLLAGAGIVAGFSRSRRSFPTVDGGRVVRAVTLVCAVLVLSVFIEGRNTPYQFSRIYPFAAILAALGAIHFIRLLRSDRGSRGYRLAVASAALFCVVFFSPLPRYIKHSFEAISRSIVDDARQRPADIEPVVSAVLGSRAPGDRTLIISGAAGVLYYHLDELPPFKIYHSAFIIPDFAPDEWKDSMRAFMLSSRPRFLIFQRSDSMPSIVGTSLSSEEAFRRLPDVDPLIRTEYRLLVRSAMFDLYRREDSTSGDTPGRTGGLR